jgi:hypothetical protein
MVEPVTKIITIIDDIEIVSALVDEGCESYAVADEGFVRRNRTKTFKIKPQKIVGASEEMETMSVTEVAEFTLTVTGWRGGRQRSWRQKTYAYVLRGLHYDLILGKPWLLHNEAYSTPHKKTVYFGKQRLSIPHADTHRWREKESRDIEAATLIAATDLESMMGHIQKEKGEEAAERTILSVRMEDVEKELRKKRIWSDKEIISRLPKEFADLVKLFQEGEGEKLPPHRPGIDHKINLRKDKNGDPLPLPWCPLYNMSTEELLVLKKKIRELLALGYIRPSASEAGAPVLFAEAGRRAKVLLRLSSIKCSNDPRPDATPTHQRNTPTSCGRQVVHKAGCTSGVPQDQDGGRRGEQDGIPDKVRALRMAGTTIRPYWRPRDISTVHQQCPTRVAGRLLQRVLRRRPGLLQRITRRPHGES